MIYFLSDAHIGSRALQSIEEHESRVVGLLKKLSADATQIWLLGDMFDYRYEYFWHQKEQYQLFIAELKQLTDKGIEVHYFVGNHDLWTFGKLEKLTGVILHREPEEVLIGNKLCFLAHGDGLVATDQISKYPKEIQKKIKHFMWLRQVFHNPILQQMFRIMPPQLGDYIGYTWAKHSREKELAKPCPYKGEANEELVGFAKEQELSNHRDYYIFGHRHIELQLELSTGAQVVILGDLFKQWTYAQMDEKGNITMCVYEQ